jgi:putative tricarboxylic transport membrane protein
MDLISGLSLGFGVAFSFDNLLFCIIGITVGTFVGVLPGIGPLAAISLALPLTFQLDPTTALIMLAGIFYGAQYGGSTASILLNLPGTASSAITCLDGYPMTQQGRAGIALFLTTMASFVGSTVSILLVAGFAPAVAEFALNFTGAEYFSIMLLGLVAASTLSVGSPLKGLAMVLFGLVIAMIGIDISSGQRRFDFGYIQLIDGISLVAVAMGLFGVSEIFASLSGKSERTRPVQKISLRSMIPTRDDWRRFTLPTLRGSGLGSVIGVLPGAGPTIAAFLAYAVEKRISREPGRFGHGAVEGISSPEAANNASVQSAFIPTLSLGIPGDAVMAVLLGALLIHGIIPGPQLISSQPEMFWGLVASFWIGNFLLLILNIPLIGIWVRMVSIPYRFLYPTILFFVCLGAYGVSNNVFDVYVTLAFGMLGYVLTRYGFPLPPLLLGFVLGPLIEENFRRAMVISRGDFMVFVERPISAIILAITVLLLLLSIRPAIAALVQRVRRAPQPR